jgi:hypothetical protein
MVRERNRVSCVSHIFPPPTSDGCHVITEEVAKGPLAVVGRYMFPRTMHEGHDVWLKTLKARSEQQ